MKNDGASKIIPTYIYASLPMEIFPREPNWYHDSAYAFGQAVMGLWQFRSSVWARQLKCSL